MTYPRPLPLSDQEIVAMPVDRLGLEILRQFSSGTQVHTYNYLNDWRNAGLQENGAPMRALAEASEWQRQRGLIAEPQGISQGFITRLGQQALQAGLPYVGAITKLNENLHPRIASVRTQFLLGEYELAALAAMKQVEVRVRELGGFDDADIGRHLMRAAFKPNEGPLHDGSLDAGEQSGLSDLFAGAIAVFKNPTSHRVVTFADPAEAAEVVGLASLLLPLGSTIWNARRRHYRMRYRTIVPLGVRCRIGVADARHSASSAAVIGWLRPPSPRSGTLLEWSRPAHGSTAQRF